MSYLQTQPQLDTWVHATWEEYLAIANDPAYDKNKSYYFDGLLRIEMAALGNPHSRDHFTVIHAVCLFAGLKNIDLDGHDNCSYRKAGCREVQPECLAISAMAIT